MKYAKKGVAEVLLEILESDDFFIDCVLYESASDNEEHDFVTEVEEVNDIITDNEYPESNVLEDSAGTNDVLCDQHVSWIRKRDLHILTAGILTYTSDQRFQVIRPDKSDNWTLQIKFPQIRDSGIYECQVNTEPKMSLPFRLNVIEAKARILGPTDLHVKAGSSITLTCLISQGPHDLGTVFWYKGENILETSHQRFTNDADYTSRLTIEVRIILD
ncbi:unnamed protein product [Psylliodes chrysocephalus]|uniref:Ig-like domain-containing protein n=1 Tax=Psylliodes chrysocephalus TaxID=3402493 RepID=A0A9P0CG19_9CUCU|nr:unnamed protein product [Psylliodes chrysocephala]